MLGKKLDTGHAVCSVGLTVSFAKYKEQVARESGIILIAFISPVVG